MGGLFSLSRISRAGVTNSAGESNSQGLYRYPPPNGGLYFSNHYYLGHRKFDTGEPEVFLFGDLQDLNYFPSKPVKFKYHQPSKTQPLRTLRSFINIQRDSIKLVKVPGSTEDYYMEFRFDSDVDCQFRVFTAISDTASIDNLVHTKCGEKDGGAGNFHYTAGSDQCFKEDAYLVKPGSLLGEEDEAYDPANDQHIIPIAILMTTDILGGPHYQEQSQLSLCTLDKFSDDNYSIKIIKQKLLVDGMELLLQELYGLENKLKPGKEEKHATSSSKEEEEEEEEEEEDLGAECVICITETRDTLLLPCRHLCLCSSCAVNLRYQSSNCPICRAPFRALLQVKALEPLYPGRLLDDDVVTGNPKYAIPGYQAVPLLQALNGYQMDIDDQHRKEIRQQQQTESSSHHVNVQTSAELCVAPMEDEVEQLGCEAAAEKSVRTTAKQHHQSCTDALSASRETAGKEFSCVVVHLPEMLTPDLTPSPSLAVDMEDDMCDGDGDMCDGDVRVCGSSISSESSVKSTDVLLHIANGKTSH